MSSLLLRPLFALDLCLAASEVNGAGFVHPDEAESILGKVSALVWEVNWDSTASILLMAEVFTVRPCRADSKR